MRLARRAARWGMIALGLLVAAALVAPLIHADRFAAQIHPAVERAVGRRIEMGEIRFTLWAGPGFSIDRVVIHEDGAFGPEPVAYVGTLRAGVRLRSLWTGRLEFSSIALEDASVNLMKAPDQAGGGWNFERLLSRANLARFPSVRVRNGRINFKFGENKSTFYLTQADIDLWPPARAGDPWSLRFEAAPARTDKPARAFGSLAGGGRWTLTGKAPSVDFEVRLNDNALADVSSLLRGYDAGVHGEISARLRLRGPLDNVRISGSASVEDIHRWDMIPPNTAGWPLELSGRLNTLAQTLELEASAGQAIPLSVRLRASGYLSRPQWGLAFTMKRFPVEPLLELARHMGAAVPDRVRLAGWVEGAVGYTAAGGLQGEFGFEETRLEIPGAAPLRFEQARLLFDGTTVTLLPAAVATPGEEPARLEASWAWDTGEWEFGIATDGMAVEVLRAQASLAAVPWMEQLRGGRWKGALRYRAGAGWSGRATFTDAVLPVPGIAGPVTIRSVQAGIEGERLSLQKLRLACGPLEAEGEYRYEPGSARPHRFRLAVPEADATDLEAVLHPSLRRRSTSLLARALRMGRAPVPDWLASRHAEGSLWIGVLHLAGVPLERVRAQVAWDGTQVAVPDVRARLGATSIEAAAAVNLRGGSPVYRVQGKWSRMEWQSGWIEGQGMLRTAGTGAQLWTNLRSAGIFQASGVELPEAGDSASLRGAYELQWGPSGPLIRLAGLHLKAGTEEYSGRGYTAGDGRLLLELASGARELRMSGTPARLQPEAPAAP